jgi:hypothetical protein
MILQTGIPVKHNMEAERPLIFRFNYVITLFLLLGLLISWMTF